MRQACRQATYHTIRGRRRIDPRTATRVKLNRPDPFANQQMSFLVVCVTCMRDFICEIPLGTCKAREVRFLPVSTPVRLFFCTSLDIEIISTLIRTYREI